MKTPYFPPPEAWRKLKLADGQKTAVYLYGATGYGKTTLVREFLGERDTLWLSARSLPWERAESLRDAKKHSCVVLDDLHNLKDETLQKQILELIASGKVWVVLIARNVPPAWLLPLVAGMKIFVIPEKDLHITANEVQKLAETMNLTLSEKDARFIAESSEGNVIGASFTLREISDGAALDRNLVEHVSRAFSEYLERFIVSEWEPDVQDFLMHVCVVDRFTIPLAEAITGDDRSSFHLKKVYAVGNIIYEKDGLYEIRPVLLKTIRTRALERFGRAEYNRCVYNAARYYELQNDLLPALKLYEQIQDTRSIKALLIRNARRHPGAGLYYELRSYYRSLPPEEIENSAVLMGAVSILYSILMDAERSEYWYDRLKQYIETSSGGDKKEAIGQLVYLDISLPHRGTVNLVEILKNAPVLLMRSEAVLPELVITSNQPSLMNGSKDFCDWSRSDSLLATTLGPITEHLLGRVGAGLSEIAMGESLYEKGADYYTVLSHLTRGQSIADNRGTLDLTAVSVSLQARLSLSAGNTTHAKGLLTGIETRARAEQQPRILENNLAVQCRLALLTNQSEEIQSWLREAPDETRDFCVLERFRYMTKIRCYLAAGQNMEALALLERMTEYASFCRRTFIGMECGILRAVVLRRMGMDWKSSFLEAMETALSYDFVRIIADEGAAVLPLLNQVQAEFLEKHPKEKKWLKAVQGETEKMARRYPGYLTENKIDLSQFSEAALQVLRMQASGFSTAQIAEQMGISPRTVKYHAKENYTKLGAKGVVEAVQLARSLNIL